MSPEQLHGEALTPASDLFSLGAVLYDALTGRPPYAGETPEEISAAHAAGGVRPPSTLVDGVPDRLDEAILQALRRDPDARFTSADAMEASLAASAGDIVEPAMTTTRPRSSRRAAGRRRRPRATCPRPLPRAAARVLRPRGDHRRLVVGTALGPRSGRSSSSAPRRWSSCSSSFRSSSSVARAGEAGPRRRPHRPQSLGSNAVVVPSLVGASTAEALAAARASGLDWTLYCNEDGASPPGSSTRSRRRARRSRPAARSACTRRDLTTASDPYTHGPSAARLKEPIEHAPARHLLHPSHDRSRRPRRPDLPRRDASSTATSPILTPHRAARSARRSTGASSTPSSTPRPSSTRARSRPDGCSSSMPERGAVARGALAGWRRSRRGD